MLLGDGVAQSMLLGDGKYVARRWRSTEYVARRWRSTAMLCSHVSKSWPDSVEPSQVCFLPKTINLLLSLTCQMQSISFSIPHIVFVSTDHVLHDQIRMQVCYTNTRVQKKW